MSYEIYHSDNGTYIGIRVTGEVTEEVQTGLMGDAIAEGKKRSISRFFVDVHDAVNTASSFQQYSLAFAETGKHSLERSSRIAVYVDAGDTSHDFIETVFINFGFNCRKFTDKTEALKWLERDD